MEIVNLKYYNKIYQHLVYKDSYSFIEKDFPNRRLLRKTFRYFEEEGYKITSRMERSEVNRRPYLIWCVYKN